MKDSMVTLERLLGLYTEASPESLPEGASPRCINGDFVVGGLLPRPGKRSVFSFGASPVEKQAGVAISTPGAFDPTEVVWTTPNNATLDLPGTYAEAILNSTGGSAPGLDQVVTASGPGTPTSLAYGPFTPKTASEIVVAAIATNSVSGISPNGAIVGGHMWSNTLTANPTTYTASFGSATPSAIVAASFFGTVLGISQSNIAAGLTSGFALPVPANHSILVSLYIGVIQSPAGTYTCTDDKGNTYALLGLVTVPSGPNFLQCGLFICQNPHGGPKNITVTKTSGGAVFSSGITIADVTGIASPPSAPQSQILRASSFNFTIPQDEVVLGIELEVSGHQTTQPADALVTGHLRVNATESPTSETLQLPLVDGQVTVGTPTELWGAAAALTPLAVNNPGFAVDLVAAAATFQIFDIYAVKLRIFTSAPAFVNFNYLKTYERTSGQINTLALDDNGTIWQEDVLNNPTVINPVYSAIEPGSFAQSATFDDREFMAFSDLRNATDMPRSYDGTNFDRLSQVGPGAPPTAASASSSVAIQSITQTPPVTHDNEESGFKFILWSVGPGSTLSGNILTIYYSRVNFGRAAPDPNIVVGEGIAIQGIPFLNGNPSLPVNGNYVVLSVGSGVPPNGNFSNPSWYFTVLAPNAASAFQFTPNSGIAGTAYQATLATMTTTAQVPDLEVGGTFQAAGTGGAPPAGYDGPWTVLETPNASQMQITSTVLNGNIATYGFNLITGTAPVVGQVVSVNETLNGNGIFNVSKQTISAVTAGSFSIQLQNANVSSAAENGAAVIFGTIFKFDPRQIVGNKLGGTLVTTGLIAAGIRKICYSFLTRDGYMTQPSPIFTFDVISGASSLMVGNLLTGPSNVIARIIHLTPADGDNFYNIPEPVTIESISGKVLNSATWVNDNVSTSVLLSFSDGVLTAATSIDTSGNNLFETSELGAPVAILPYGNRLFAIGEQNKIQNLLNYSFDGGVISLPQASGGGSGPSQTYPAGWLVDPVFGVGGSVLPSPLFGFAYSIAFSGGGTSGVIGMITQAAFQDEFEVPIIVPATTYSVRVTLEAVDGGSQVTGNVIVDLFSPSLGIALGSFSIDLSTISGTMKVLTGTLLTKGLAPVPGDLVLRLYANNLSNNGQVLIDRIEPFPTDAPNLSTQVIASYQGNFEAFDRVEGVVNVSVQNQQPVKTGFVLYDTLYFVKSGSLVSTQDNKTTQPSQWATPRMVSQVVGTTSIYGVDSGEEWALIAGQPGLFLFNGGEPIKLMEEIQSVWNQINWAYGHTLWVKNDIVNRRIFVAVPMKARDKQGNFPLWLPEGTIPDSQNPTTPNVILMLNYKQLNTASALAGRPQVHVSSFGGKLISIDMARKWSIWTIKAPCGAFIKRADTQEPLFIGNSDSTGKVYELVDGLLEDDSVAFHQRWVTHGFPTGEQEQGLQLGPTRKTFSYLLAVLDGTGELAVTAFPNSLDSPYAHDLLPNLILPASNNGDVELPVNEVGNRLFLEFGANAVGAGFQLSKLALAIHPEPWAQVRGRNN